MEKYHNTLQDTAGNVITTATVTVYLANTGTLASLKEDDETTALSNPFTVSDANYDANGAIFFKATNGTYDIKVVNGGDTTWLEDVTLLDYADAAPTNNYIATTDPTVNDDSSAGYSEGSVWVNLTTDEAYKCLDDTVGAAVWDNTTFIESEAVITSLIYG